MKASRATVEREQLMASTAATCAGAGGHGHDARATMVPDAGGRVEAIARAICY